MEDFNFYSPTKIYFGRGKEKNVGEYIKEFGFKKILLHYGKQSIFKSGLYDKVISSLKSNNIDYVELGGVEANPDVSLVREGIEICKKESVDFILAIGGGSVIDSAKLISLARFYQGDPLEVIMNQIEPSKTLKVGCILTIAAAGSELSASSVISDRTIKFKRGFLTDLNRPVFVIENPELTYSLPAYQVGCGIVDIISHTLERYFNKSSEHEFSDYIAEGLLKSIIDASEIILKDFYNYDARGTLMIGSSFSHNNVTNVGKKNLLPIHQLEHEVSALKPEVAHGAGLAVLIPGWMEVCYKYDKDKFIKFAKNVMMINSQENDELLIIEGINKLRDLFNRLGMPSKLREFNINNDDIEYMVNHLTNDGTKVFPSNIPLTKELALEIFNKCL